MAIILLHIIETQKETIAETIISSTIVLPP